MPNKLEAEAREFLRDAGYVGMLHATPHMATFARKKLEEASDACRAEAMRCGKPTRGCAAAIACSERIRLLMGDEAESREEPDGT